MTKSLFKVKINNSLDFEAGRKIDTHARKVQLLAEYNIIYDIHKVF